MRQARALTVGASAFVAIVLGAAPAVAGGGERPRTVTVRAGAEVVRASQGSWCYSRHGLGQCADYLYPLKVKRSLAVTPGETIELKMHDRTIGRLSASLLKVRGNRIHGRGKVNVEQSAEHPGTWLATIPADADDANRIDIGVIYELGAGDSDWWAGLKLTEPTE